MYFAYKTNFTYISCTSGKYLACPEEIKSCSWPAEEFYHQIASKCFVIEPNERIQFKDISKLIEYHLNEREKLHYISISNKYFHDQYLPFPRHSRESANIATRDLEHVRCACAETTNRLALPTSGYLQLPNAISTTYWA